MCLTFEMEHNIECCVRARLSQQRVILERLRERVEVLREEIRKIEELREYVEDIASSESNVRAIFGDFAKQNMCVNYKNSLNEKDK